VFTDEALKGMYEKYEKNPGKPGFFMPTKMNQVPTPVFDLLQGAVFA
jgi:hypothetical protein